MMCDGEDEYFGDLKLKSGLQTREKEFLLGALPGYTGALSADVVWAKRKDLRMGVPGLTDVGAGALGDRAVSSLDDFRATTQMHDDVGTRLTRYDGYISPMERRGTAAKGLVQEHESMCSWDGHKHRIPGYSGHIPRMKADSILGATYSKATLTAYEADDTLHGSVEQLRKGMERDPLRTRELRHRSRQLDPRCASAPPDTHQHKWVSRLKTKDLVMKRLRERISSAILDNRLQDRVGQQAQKIFRYLDLDSSGDIAPSELHAALMDLNLGLSKEEIQEFLQEVKLTSKAGINIVDFVGIFSALDRNFDSEYLSSLWPAAT
eukprot:CAMPEP_0113708774 /NCGR_PEP_ID=MMETSP0038_2-20120614/29180_1 /TAXON_ID=2898 /ORGANISM="Cryptomonas paramecium" /LENGTH=320 /DNA_ID=CAMNT_0000634541 /DNA_START=246 /DNA_END=1204 /DNA_ORIENTATION=+ /assembly_acc=CAM_ASM_000170